MKLDGKLLRAMDDVDMRAPEDRAERPGPPASPISTQPMNIREEFMRAEARGPKARVRIDPGNPSDAEREENNATHLPLRCWCEHCFVGKMPGSPTFP